MAIGVTLGIIAAIVAAAQQLKSMREQSKARMEASETQPKKGRVSQIAALASSAMNIKGAVTAKPSPTRGPQMPAHTSLTGETTRYATNYPKWMKQEQIDFLGELKKYYSY